MYLFFHKIRSKHENECKNTKYKKLHPIHLRAFDDFDYMKNSKYEDIILGKGAFSEVKLVKDKIKDELFAMKIVFNKKIPSLIFLLKQYKIGLG